MAIGLHELRHSSAHLVRAFRSPILPVFALVTAAEAVLVLMLPGMTSDVVAAMLGNPLLGIFSAGSGVLSVLALVIALLALDLFRTALWGGLRRVALHGDQLSTSDVVLGALGRVGALFVTQQIIGGLVFLVSGICILLGLMVQTIPHALVTFTLAPALYAVVAMRRPIGHSLSQAARITRHNFVAVFAIQTALLALGYWVAEFFQSVTISPLVGGYAAITLLIVYRFAYFFGMGSLFLALEEAGEFER